MKENPIIECECGCGEKFLKYGKYGRERRFFPTHQWVCTDYAARIRPVIERLMRRVKKTDSCWIWTGTKNNKGYGQIRDNQRIQYVHRISYEFHKGPIPDGLNVLHKCDTPLCVNPDHLLPGTQADNIHDAMAKKRLRPFGREIK